MDENQPISAKMDQRVANLLAALRREIMVGSLSTDRVRMHATELLGFLASPEGRTDANCSAVDSALMTDDALQDRIGLIENADPVLAEVLRDMGGTLHDSVSAPEIASNFESTPEQLLHRLAASHGPHAG